MNVDLLVGPCVRKREKSLAHGYVMYEFTCLKCSLVLKVKGPESELLRMWAESVKNFLLEHGDEVHGEKMFSWNA